MTRSREARTGAYGLTLSVNDAGAQRTAQEGKRGREIYDAILSILYALLWPERSRSTEGFPPPASQSTVASTGALEPNTRT